MSTPLPPPDPFTHDHLHAPPLAVRRRRGRTALAAVAGAAAMAGLLGVVPTLASASSSPSTSFSTDDGSEQTTPDAPDAPDAPKPTAPPSPGRPPVQPAPDGNVACSGSIAVTIDGEGFPDVDSETIGNCDDLFADAFPIDEEAMAAFETCMDELDEITDGLPALPSGTVTVDGANGPTIYDFGEGDGSITITKSGDDISVARSGDVTEFDLSALDKLWEEHAAQFDQCFELLPDPPAIDLDRGTAAGSADSTDDGEGD
jgi:hypothetical protein